MDALLRVVSEATLRRLPSYLRLLNELAENKRTSVSCTEIAERFAQDSTQVRKDLETVGGEGRPRVGFEIKEIKERIEAFIGWNNTNEAFLVGAGNLGAALAGYDGFKSSGLSIAAVFDNNPAKTGGRLAGKPVLAIERFQELARRMCVHIGIIAVPARFAQDVADMMLAAGILAIWNFAPCKLMVPEGLVIENADLTPSFASLSTKLRIMKTGRK